MSTKQSERILITQSCFQMILAGCCTLPVQTIAYFLSLRQVLLFLPFVLKNYLHNYVKHWSVLMNICEEHRHKTDSIVYKKMVDIGLKRNAEDLLKWLEPIFYSFHFDLKRCTVAEAVHIWKKIEIELKDVDKYTFKSFQCVIQARIGSLLF